MQAVLLFLLIFCGIFGAAALLRYLYGAAVTLLSKRYKKYGKGRDNGSGT